MTDFHRVDERHRDIDQRLERWGRWITRHPRAWKVLPMFAQYRSHAWQWETPEVIASGTPAENWEIERAVSLLPDKHRTAIRWAYAWPWVPVRAVRQHLGLTGPDLQRVLVDGRDILANRPR